LAEKNRDAATMPLAGTSMLKFLRKRKRRVRESGAAGSCADQPKQKKPNNPTIINPAPVTRMMLAKRFAECKFDAWKARSDPRA
jgi:hypothetical protein